MRSITPSAITGSSSSSVVERLRRFVGEPHVGDVDRRRGDVGLDPDIDRLAVGGDDVDHRELHLAVVVHDGLLFARLPLDDRGVGIGGFDIGRGRTVIAAAGTSGHAERQRGDGSAGHAGKHAARSTIPSHAETLRHAEPVTARSGVGA